MVITDPDLVEDKFAGLISQNHRDYVATVFNRTTLRKSDLNLIRKLRILKPSLFRVSILKAFSRYPN